MSKIDYQKLREIAEKTKIAGEAPVMPFDQRINALNDFMKHFSPDIALALLDEINALEETRINDVCRIAELTKQLELAKSKLNEQREYYEGVISDGSKRIAELESDSQAQKLVEAIIVAIENEQERLFDEDYLMDSKECIDVIREEVKRWNDSRAAGIRIKGE
ncbi:ead/Ea22-like family protein [Escherichia coli]|mgnify:CR=1 FL=1|uniref:ead/Ea22-like family protein n=1 Tax=Escherichia coli TaxID=562 RepID=UPI00039018F4|nr:MULTISPECIES: ead/Ea22-like family protein [Enterobacteriaceae]EYE13378.1 ead/Ea22-like family protein [Escherichia coli 1-110-08_S3_C3]EYE25174.1 ead/Ea22-like family protein [Escherichia coli 1-110-08_S3_C2]EYE27117.1 ead/Ea22-like family protein [Escherichia coli 1-110-08_S3_C1]HCH8950142.1 ead/Ea22-like family protein [Shigella flexneri]EAA4790354.1 ead/Ea22-like family protein [Escherichia coli]